MMNTKTTLRVLVVQRIIPPYRLPFFNSIHNIARQHGIELEVAFGQAQPGEIPQSVPANAIPDAQSLINRFVPGTSAIWQSLPVRLDYDLIIVEQANRLLLNYALMVRRSLTGRPARLAFWAHGMNWQGDPQSWRERWKRRMRGEADYWLCYTDRVVDSLADVPAERKCSIDNAIDTMGLATAVSRAATTVVKDPQHLLFIGSMRPDKRFPWIFSALDAAHTSCPGVTASFVGDGPEVASVRTFCATRPWAVMHGAVHGTATAPYLQRAGGILMPGLVGLVVLDSFVAEAPLLTTPFNGQHSPEFAYATPGVNALVSADTQEAYIAMVVAYVADPARQVMMRANCHTAAGRYTIANMAERFVAGIERALALPPRCPR